MIDAAPCFSFVLLDVTMCVLIIYLVFFSIEFEMQFFN